MKIYDPGPRHEKFDEMWQKYARFLWWCARRCSNKIGGSPESHMSWLTLRFNRHLRTYKEEKGKFTTYFTRRLYSDAYRIYVSKDSEMMNLVHAKYQKKVRNSLTPNKNLKKHYIAFKDFIESESPKQVSVLKINSRHENIDLPFQEDNIEEIIKCFKNQDLLRYVCKSLNPKQSDILLRKFVNGETLEEIAKRYKISKERARQLLNKVLNNLKTKMNKDWSKIFKINEGSLLSENKFDVIMAKINKGK